MLLLLLTTFTVVFAQETDEIDTAPICEPSGIAHCYDCGFAQDFSPFATHPDWGVSIFCVNCYNGYYPLAGQCYTMEELLEGLSVSIVDDIAVFQSDLLLDSYKTMWTWKVGNEEMLEFEMYDTLGYISQEVLGDEYDYLYVSTYNDVAVTLCAEQTTEEYCNYVETCQWLEDGTCGTNAWFPDRFHRHDSVMQSSNAGWQPYVYETRLQGTIRNNFKRHVDLTNPDLTAFELMGTHFHELGHDFLVHGMSKNPDNPHWGYSVLEAQSDMSFGHTWRPEEVSCFETGEPITSPDSCPPSEDGKQWLHFESSIEDVQEFVFSNWDLLAMGLLHPDDMAGQTFFYCGSIALTDTTAEELEKYPTGSGWKVGCNEVIFVTPEEWAWGEEYHQVFHEWHPRTTPFTAAHMVLQGTDEELPTTAEELNAHWKKFTELLPELTENFKTATKNLGEVDFSMSEKAPECYIFRDDHTIEGEYTLVGDLGAFTMEECEVHCTLNPDCTAWSGSPYNMGETYYELTGEQNGVVWGVSWCRIFTGEVTFTVSETTQTNNAYGPNDPSNTYWTGERVFPIPEGCEADGLTFPPTDLPTTAPSTEIPLCYISHTEYGQSCSSEYPVQGEQITTEECQALCSQDEECLGWQYPTWCTLLKGESCHFVAGGWPWPVAYQKNPDYFPESCVNPATPEPTTTAEPTLHPTMEDGLSLCYHEFTDAQVTGGQWDTEDNVSEEACEGLCTADPSCVGYSMKFEMWSSSQWAYVDRCYNYHGATEWEAGFYSVEVLSYKKVLPEPANCLPGWEPVVVTPEEPVEEVTPEPTPEPTEATMEPTPEPTEATPEPTPEPTEATPEPTEATMEPTEATPEPTAEPTEATLEPTMATTEPTAATEEPTVDPTSSPTDATPVAQTSVKFTQVVSADVECEQAKGDVQSANAQALSVPTSAVDVSGCERRVLAAAGDSVETFEFLISVVVATASEADALREQVASTEYAERVTERLSAVTVTSSSNPVVEYEAVSEESSESQDQTYDSQSSILQEAGIEVIAVILVALMCCLCVASYFFVRCCGKEEATPAGKLCETGSVPEGSLPATNNLELVL